MKWAELKSMLLQQFGQQLFEYQRRNQTAIRLYRPSPQVPLIGFC